MAKKQTFKPAASAKGFDIALVSHRVFGPKIQYGKIRRIATMANNGYQLLVGVESELCLEDLAKMLKGDYKLSVGGICPVGGAKHVKGCGCY